VSPIAGSWSGSGETAGVSIVPPPACRTWIDDRLVVGDSGIDGRGLFATDLVPAGTVVMRLGGRLISSIELEFLLAAADADSGGSYVDTITVNENAHLVLPPGSRIHFANHSCDPSLWHIGPYEITARRHLHEGDEVTIDYATHSGADGFVMACRCGSKACRGQVTGDDWMLSELQQRYRGHWVPALQQRIDCR
jgi:SET domain-containing protein